MVDPEVVSVPVFVALARDYNYSIVGALTWIVYDWMVCLEDEVELIWKSPNTLPKFMYLFSRYYGLLTISLLASETVLPSYCGNRLIFQAISYQLLLLSLELSLILRVYAIWERNKYVTRAICFTFILAEGWSIGLVIRAFLTVFPTIRPFPPDLPFWPHGCFVDNWPSWYRLCWVPTLILETLLFVLNTVKCLSTVGWMRAPTLSRLLRDGSMYFAGLFVVLVIDTVSQYCPNSAVSFMIDTSVSSSLQISRVFIDLCRWIPAAISFAGSRLLLSIRVLYTERQRVGNVSAVETGAELSFVHPQPGPVASHANVEVPPVRRHSYPPNHPPNTSHTRSGIRKSLCCHSARTCGRPFLPTFCNPRREGEDTAMSRYMSGWLAEWDCR